MTWKKYDIRKAIHLEKNLLAFSGFYPRKPGGKMSVFSISSAIFNLVLAYGQIFLLFIQMYLDRGDFPKLTGSVLYFMTHFTFICKQFTFSYSHHGNILKLEHDFLGNEEFHEFDAVSFEIFQQRMSLMNAISVLYRMACVCGCTFWGLAPFFGEPGKYELPLPGTLPYDVSAWYTETYLFEIIGIYLSAYNNTAIDILTWKFTILACLQLEVLKIQLEKIDFRKEPREIMEKLKKCVKRHEKTFQMLKLIEETFLLGIFMQFFTSVIVICVTLFQIMVVPFPTTQFFALSSYIGAMLLQIALYCWFGHDVIFTSKDIGQSLYMSNWYECKNLSVRKMMLILLSRTQKPMMIRAGFVGLSLGTLTQIFRSSYSYFTVLRRVYNGS